jgi:AAA domain
MCRRTLRAIRADGAGARRLPAALRQAATEPRRATPRRRGAPRAPPSRRYARRVRRILITGMSGTGKSTALAELATRGFRVVDTDEPGWQVCRSGEWVWRDDRIDGLLAGAAGGPLFVSGCVANQGAFYDRFEAVVLLSAPERVILDRIETRTTNAFGKEPEERSRIRSDLAEIEPLLRATCTHEIDATLPVAEVVGRLIEIAAGG